MRREEGPAGAGSTVAPGLAERAFEHPEVIVRAVATVLGAERQAHRAEELTLPDLLARLHEDPHAAVTVQGADLLAVLGQGLGHDQDSEVSAAPHPPHDAVRDRVDRAPL